MGDVQTDLAEPDVLLARWGAIASALATLGHDDVWWIDGGTAYRDDHGGNWGRLVPVEGGRAVLYGFDHEYSATTDASPPIDLLAGAPVWLPWPDLLRFAEEQQLGFVYWYDGGWSRVPYPDGIADGLTAALPAVVSEERAHRALREVVFGWARHKPANAAEEAEVADAAARLLAAATSRTVDVATLAGLLGRIGNQPVDLDAGLATAAGFGLVAGSTAPTVPAGTGEPPRRVRMLSDDERQDLVWAAMRSAAELPRPVPAPTAELAALVDWARSRAQSDGRCSLRFEVLDNARCFGPGEAAPVGRPGDNQWAVAREVGELAKRLWEAEADPAHGHWIFLRLEVSTDGHTVERHYDSWPDWMKFDGISGPWPDDLRIEMDRRAAAFRPAWSVLLDPGLTYTGVPEPFRTPEVD
ncbi:hypothetical protein GCM10009779_70990 [Polymorphospora rubra]|uniref:Uncharacterized protein n=1 Tax=Polymorphospora rubra TaxID=338584 RepID=A0A810MSS8_9ACTN|nr:hypothetical protein Prubr_12680 [Polymorphospora rubra]